LDKKEDRYRAYRGNRRRHVYDDSLDSIQIEKIFCDSLDERENEPNYMLDDIEQPQLEQKETLMSETKEGHLEIETKNEETESDNEVNEVIEEAGSDRIQGEQENPIQFSVTTNEQEDFTLGQIRKSPSKSKKRSLKQSQNIENNESQNNEYSKPKAKPRIRLLSQLSKKMKTSAISKKRRPLHNLVIERDSTISTPNGISKRLYSIRKRKTEKEIAIVWSMRGIQLKGDIANSFLTGKIESGRSLNEVPYKPRGELFQMRRV